MIESAIVGGASGVLAGQAVDTVAKSESEQLLLAVRKLSDVADRLLAVTAFRNEREREQTPDSQTLTSVFGGATQGFNPSSTYRVRSLLVCNLHNAAQTVQFARGSRTFTFIIPATDVREFSAGLFPFTLNGGTSLVLTAQTGGSIIAFLNGYYERRENMGRNTIEPL